MQFKKKIIGLRKKLGRFPMLIATHVLGSFFWKRGIVFLTWYHGSSRSIGEMALQFDLYVKMGILGWGPACKGILLTRGGNIANLCFSNYWRRYIRIISNPLIVHLLFPLAAFIQYNTASIKMPDGDVLPEDVASAIVQKQWADEGRPPLLTVSNSHFERGWDCLEQLGVPRRAWFVCIHARESGYFNQYNDSFDSQRNVDINTYLLAVKTIVEAGGWVIRMGDPTMKPLPPMDHVIDYVHSEVRSDWMDIFCCAECRFFLGTNSGLHIVSFDFGVPCALTNYIPFATLPISGKHIYIPKLYWSTTEERYLTFKEALTPPLDFTDNNNVFKLFNIKIVDNTPEEINDLVLEMLDRLNGSIKYSEEDENLQEEFFKLLPYKKRIGGKMGRAFLRKYARLLPDAGIRKNDFS